MSQPPIPLIPASEVQVRDDANILAAIEVIDRSTGKIALIVDTAGKLVGSVTDGDVRRGLLKGFTPQSPVKDIMFISPHVMAADKTKQQIITAMEEASIKQIPLLNKDGTLLGIAVYDTLTGFMPSLRENIVVIMAGGKGKRMLPLTSEIPKPMAEVGGKPILEHNIEKFIRQGFHQFEIAVNYLSHFIEAHFGDGEKWGCRITYIRETQFMGTAGALSLIKKPDEPFIVINGDIMTSVDFGDLLDYHINCNSMATVCARTHRLEVPYGVIQMKDAMLQAIVEKPVYEDLISAGIYVINPEILRYVPKDKVMDMPMLLQDLVQDGCKVAVFPLHEEWADVGTPADLEQVNRNFKTS